MQAIAENGTPYSPLDEEFRQGTVFLRGRSAGAAICATSSGAIVSCNVFEP